MFTSRGLALASAISTATISREITSREIILRAARYTLRPDANYTIGEFDLIPRSFSRQRIIVGEG